MSAVTLNYVAKAIGKALNKVEQDRRYDVTLRVYHGWHKGFEQSVNRRALIQVFAGADFPSLSARTNVIIRPTLNFGDFLISALPTRFHAHVNCHLPNTLRRDLINRSEVQEKMVDSAIAGEVVDLAYREPSRWLLIAGEDDDLIPALFIAEGVRSPQMGRVLILRSRADSPFLKLDGLRVKP